MWEELETVHEEVIAEIQIISFRDFARETLEDEGKLGTRVGVRQLRFLLALERHPVSITALRSGQHPLSGLYSDVTPKTLMRDIHFLQRNKLIIVSGNELRANLEVMRQFTAKRPGELLETMATPGN